MIDPSELQSFLLNLEGGTLPVDLVKIGKSHNQKPLGGNSKSNKSNYAAESKYRLLVDMEDCLDRFYGGYFNDWACGGQWNRAYQFVSLLLNAFMTANIEIVAFFDGTTQENKRRRSVRAENRERANSVIRHIRSHATPPPKIWWLPPSGLRNCIRNALRSNKVQTMQSVYDHTGEVIAYYKEHHFNGILGLNPDYIIENVCRYFSSHDLRLCYKGPLETKEFLVSKLLSTLSLTAHHLPFVATLLGGYNLLDDEKIKNIYEKIKIAGTIDYETRIKKIAEIVRNSPTNEITEFINHLGLTQWAKEITESVEHYQRNGKITARDYGNKKKLNLPSIDMKAHESDPPMASEAFEGDSSLLVDDMNKMSLAGGDATNETDGSSSLKTTDEPYTFNYILPGEVLRTSFNRHRRGMMDSRIYQLLTKREILLPQILEDEQHYDMGPIHLFYRPARQMIYAILFSYSHQKYLFAKNKPTVTNGDKKAKEPEVLISEWVWSPGNEYERPDIVSATPPSWAVPTIKRLWFGVTYEDKQRRMKAFLSVMRSDSPLMLNCGYVPQQMLVMACVLRYMVTSPDRNVRISRVELDAFLATAFSPYLPNVEYTQGLDLNRVHLRGIYLATLFMQGVETAALANDACGVPLPWMFTNPWLFFDGKLFHLKIKMTSVVQNILQLCDDHIEIVTKIERFRKAILEDVEHFLLSHNKDTVRHPNYLFELDVQGNPIHLLPLAASNVFYNQSSSNLQHMMGANPYHSVSGSMRSNANNPNSSILGRGQISRSYYSQSLDSSSRVNNLLPRNTHNTKGYQLKVGGVVVGSWADNSLNQVNRSLRTNNFYKLPLNSNLRPTSNRGAYNVRLQRNIRGVGTNRINSRNFTTNNKMQRTNRNKRVKKDIKKPTTITKSGEKKRVQISDIVEELTDKNVTSIKPAEQDNKNDNNDKKNGNENSSNYANETTPKECGSVQSVVTPETQMNENSISVNGKGNQPNNKKAKKKAANKGANDTGAEVINSPSPGAIKQPDGESVDIKS